MSVSLAHENVKNAVHPLHAFLAEMLMTLTEDKQIISTNNTLCLPAVLWREKKTSWGVPRDYQLTTETSTTPFSFFFCSLFKDGQALLSWQAFLEITVSILGPMAKLSISPLLSAIFLKTITSPLFPEGKPS